MNVTQKLIGKSYCRHTPEGSFLVEINSAGVINGIGIVLVNDNWPLSYKQALEIVRDDEEVLSQ